jgi:hypothetical protein
MKKIRFYSCFIVVILILFHLAGCGKGEVVPEATEPPAIEPAAPQAVAEQRPDMTGQDNSALSQETGRTTALTVAQPPVQGIADVIMIENQGYEPDNKGPVKFNHLKHSKEYKASCVECHHLYQDGKNIWKEGDHVNKCVVCHDPVEEKGKAVKLRSAFHNNCRDCHTKASKEGREAPYKKCSECHGD